MTCANPNSRRIIAILLPIYAQMTEDNLVRIADALRKQVAGDRRRTGLRIGEKIGG